MLCDITEEVVVLYKFIKFQTGVLVGTIIGSVVASIVCFIAFNAMGFENNILQIQDCLEERLNEQTQE